MKSKAILIRMDEQEFRTAREEADKLGMTVAAFMRLLLRQWHDGIRFERERAHANRNTR